MTYPVYTPLKNKPGNEYPKKWQKCVWVFLSCPKGIARLWVCTCTRVRPWNKNTNLLALFSKKIKILDSLIPPPQKVFFWPNIKPPLRTLKFRPKYKAGGALSLGGVEWMFVERGIAFKTQFFCEHIFFHVDDNCAAQMLWLMWSRRGVPQPMCAVSSSPFSRIPEYRRLLRCPFNLIHFPLKAVDGDLFTDQSHHPNKPLSKHRGLLAGVPASIFLFCLCFVTVTRVCLATVVWTKAGRSAYHAFHSWHSKQFLQFYSAQQENWLSWNWEYNEPMLNTTLICVSNFASRRFGSTATRASSPTWPARSSRCRPTISPSVVAVRSEIALEVVFTMCVWSAHPAPLFE